MELLTVHPSKGRQLNMVASICVGRSLRHRPLLWLLNTSVTHKLHTLSETNSLLVGSLTVWGWGYGNDLMGMIPFAGMIPC